MTWEMIFILVLLGLGIVSFVWEKIPSDLTAGLLFSIVLAVGLWSENLPQVNELLGVFANPAPLTIAAMFIISAALEKCGAIASLAAFIGKFARLGYHSLLLIIIVIVALASAFINNTPVVVMFMPVVLTLARRSSIPASKMLIPLSYASIFGGTCTLIGTSTNILASGILEDFGQAPLSMFELAAVGLPLMIAGTVYLVIFAYRALPVRETLTSILSREERKEYIIEAFIKHGSALEGKAFSELKMLNNKGLRVLEVIRNAVTLDITLSDVTLCEGDRLLLACRPEGVKHARDLDGLGLVGEKDWGLETITAQEGALVEGVIGPKSTLPGKTLSQIRFRQRYRLSVLAIHRRGENVRKNVDREPLQFGDTLLMIGTQRALEELENNDDILLLEQTSVETKKMGHKAPLVLTILTGFVLVNALTAIPIVASAILTCLLLLLTRCIESEEAYASVEWSILLLIYGMLGVGLAMEKTGVAALLAGDIASVLSAFVADPWLPLALLATVYLFTSVLTEFLSNNATIVLAAPIAFSLAETAGLDARPFIIAACIASSASFSTPIGYQTNTYIYGVGGYRFSDFCKVGLPLNFIYFIGTILLVPYVWPLR